MLKKLFTVLLFFSSSLVSSAGTDVVYPASKHVTINAPSTFVFGQTDKGASFYINNSPVDLWEGVFFVHVVPLNYGKNEIVFSSVLNGVKTDTVYTVTRNGKNTGNAPGSYLKVQNVQPTVTGVTDFKDIYRTKTKNNNSTMRDNPSSSANRVTELPEGVVLYISGRKGDYYRIADSDGIFYWIHKSNVEPLVIVPSRETPVLKDFKYYDDSDYDYFKFCLSHPVPYKIKQDGKAMFLTLFGVKSSNGNNHVHTFNFLNSVAGYDCHYEGNNLIFRKAKNPLVEKNERPLEGIKIFVDAGHGGEEKGAVGPTRLCEKDINLSVSNKVIDLLRKEGAIVSYSRNDDRKVPLYERVALAKANNAFISLSIHSNSLPPGKSPYDMHGTEVHYYNDNAKYLAQIINENLAADLNLKNNGIHRSSFALDRSTNPVSVLVEVAYMINPSEYILLKNDYFRQKTAESIVKSIKKYIIDIKR